MLNCPKCKSKRWNGRYCKRCNFENSKKKDCLMTKNTGDFIPMQFNEEEADEIMEEEKELTEEELDNLLK